MKWPEFDYRSRQGHHTGAVTQAYAAPLIAMLDLCVVFRPERSFLSSAAFNLFAPELFFKF
jgi:hypothetical protein